MSPLNMEMSSKGHIMSEEVHIGPISQPITDLGAASIIQ